MSVVTELIWTEPPWGVRGRGVEAGRPEVKAAWCGVTGQALGWRSLLLACGAVLPLAGVGEETEAQMSVTSLRSHSGDTAAPGQRDPESSA